MATATDAAATSSEATRMDDASERAPLATADPAYGHDVEAGDTAHVAAADSSGAAAAAVDTGVGEGGLGSGHVVERVSERAPAKVGNTILLFAAASDHYDAKWFPRKCIVGPDWPCLSYTYALLIVPNMLHILFVADDYALVFQILAYAVFIFAVCALSFTACSDPGILKRQSLEYAQDQQIQGKRGNYCNICHVKKKLGTVHCYECDCCIEELDHHCPWTGKCVGKHNLQFFYTFLVALVIDIIYVVGGIFIHLASTATGA